MTAIEPGRVVAVVGTGTMGQDIARGRERGAWWVRNTLECPHEEYPTGRYAPSQALRRLAAAQEDDAS